MKTEIASRLSFSGGVHPPEKKDLTRDSEIQAGPAVTQVAIMLSQHAGAVCRPLVRKGNMVQAGQKVGDSDAFVSAPVHSPINGKVRETTLRSHPVLGRSPAIVIDAFRYTPTKQPRFELDRDFDENGYSAEQICDAVRQAGIVGMGGAGFPTRVKIEPNPRLPKHTMIVNGCECEPYVTCDYRLMIERPHQIIAGVKLAQRAAGCSRVLRSRPALLPGRACGVLAPPARATGHPAKRPGCWVLERRSYGRRRLPALAARSRCDLPRTCPASWRPRVTRRCRRLGFQLPPRATVLSRVLR